MDSIQFYQAVNDTIFETAKYALALEHAQEQNKFYIWVLGITAGIIVGLVSFVAYSWQGKLSELTNAINELTKNLVSTTHKLELSMAEEVAHRGFCIEKHKQHDDDIKLLRSDVDHVTHKVDIIIADHNRIHPGETSTEGERNV